MYSKVIAKHARGSGVLAIDRGPFRAGVLGAAGSVERDLGFRFLEELWDHLF